MFYIFNSPEPEAHKVRAYSIPVEPSSVGGSVSLFTLSNMNISATSRPNSTKSYLKHHLGGGLTALEFGPGSITVYKGTVVKSEATIDCTP